MDTAGNVNLSSANHTAWTAPDTTPPQVTGTLPTDGAGGVAVDANITITLSESVEPGVNYSNITLGSGNPVAINTLIDNATLTVDPTDNLAKGTRYTLHLPQEAVNDTWGNPLNTSYAFSFTTEKEKTTTTSNSGSSGSGGGGGGAAEPYENVERRETRYVSFQSGDVVSVDFQRTGVLSGLDLRLRSTLSDVAVVVEELKPGVVHSDLVSESAPGQVYRNVNIWVGLAGTATRENTRLAQVRFKVPQAWTMENNVSPDHVYLYRWHEDRWSQLNTTHTAGDDEYYYYRATTPGFSPFAISGEPTNDERAGGEIQPAPSPSPEATISATPKNDLPTPIGKGLPGFTLCSSLAGLVSMAYLLRKR